jgi:hypothetical protein
MSGAFTGRPVSNETGGEAAVDRPATRTAALNENAEANMKKPFMFREAKLPAGYPAPGPVGEVVVKTYPASRMAVVSSAALGGAGPNGMFRPLFDHIKRENIAMTAPVVMSYTTPGHGEQNPRPRTMAFVYADPDIGATGAAGRLPVEVVDVPALTVVSIGVRGTYSEKQTKRAVEQLDAWLADHGGEKTRAGSPRYLAYNSPLVPWFLRYGEVQLPVVRVSR